MTPEPLHTYGPASDVGTFWRDLREAVGPDLPEPEVLDEGAAILWDTPCYEVRVEVPEKGEAGEGKIVRWQGRRKASGCRSAGRGSPLACATLALWLGRLCGESEGRGIGQ